MFKLIMSPIIIGVGFYFYFFLKRAFKIFSKKEYGKKEKIINIVVSALIFPFLF